MELSTCEELLDPPYFDTSSSSVHLLRVWSLMPTSLFPVNITCFKVKNINPAKKSNASIALENFFNVILILIFDYLIL